MATVRVTRTTVFEFNADEADYGQEPTVEVVMQHDVPEIRQYPQMFNDDIIEQTFSVEVLDA